jgi:hypothetical protein
MLFFYIQGFLDVLEAVDNGWTPPPSSANSTVSLYRETVRPVWTETRPIKRTVAEMIDEKPSPWIRLEADLPLE